jgi:hypothetical protein
MSNMTSDRTQAYGRVVKTLEEIGPAKLQPAEQARIRDAADTLIFAADLDEARATLEDIDALVEHLVTSGRWTSERAEQLAADLLACVPGAPTRINQLPLLAQRQAARTHPPRLTGRRQPHRQRRLHGAP